ncbi:MAG TPA: rRNA adenine N-6-methyltransferase family protein [Rhodoblastus sp.]|nr:rRNA adenine N-6-methyltransferase family protein [Rhodoblastus sp.]
MPSPSAISAQARAEAKAQLLLRLRRRGDVDLPLLRAIEAAPREAFVHAEYADLALRDVAIPLPCGQTMEAPTELARMISALAPSQNSRILEIGTGSGYSAKVLALLSREVVSVECFERLAQEAQERLERFRATNVSVVWADGFEIGPSLGLFDRILIHGGIDGLPAAFAGALADDGVLVAPRGHESEGGCVLERCQRAADGSVVAKTLGPWRGPRLLHGSFGRL